MDDRDFLAEVFAERMIEGADVEGWTRRKQDLTVALLADSPRVYPGVVELVRAVCGRVRLAVVSTTWRENITTVLQASGLAEAFEVIVGKQDVRAVKPDPEGYRLALQLLAIAAGDAVALEDSATGLTAARAAGLRTLAVGHRLPLSDWVGTSDSIAHFRKTSAVLEKLALT